MTDYSRVRCPVCKGTLVMDGGLLCARCETKYPIIGDIPVMLPDRPVTDGEQDIRIEKDFYEQMFGGLRGPEDGHCITYGHERIYDFLDGLERGTLLEAGCGAGHNGISLSKRGFEVTSIDLTLNGVRAAKQLAQGQHQDILYVCGDIKRLPFEDNAFDICFCALVLHHFVGLDNVIKELARVTKRHFVAFEVSALDPISFIRFNVINPTIGISNISRNQRALFPGRLKKTLTRHGFEQFVTRYDDMHEYFGRRPDSAKAQLLRAYQKLMKIFPPRYSQNKFMLRASKRTV